MRSHHLQRRGALALALFASTAALAACGTPSTPSSVTPTPDPLPGLGHDVQAARGVVAQSQQEAQDFGSTSVSAP